MADRTRERDECWNNDSSAINIAASGYRVGIAWLVPMQLTLDAPHALTNNKTLVSSEHRASPQDESDVTAKRDIFIGILMPIITATPHRITQCRRGFYVCLLGF